MATPPIGMCSFQHQNYYLGSWHHAEARARPIDRSQCWRLSEPSPPHHPMCMSHRPAELILESPDLPKQDAEQPLSFKHKRHEERNGVPYDDPSHGRMAIASVLQAGVSLSRGIVMEEASLLLIFDFDHSLIDCNSDPWVVDHLGASQLMLSLRPAIPSWTDLMDRMMVELAARGNTVGDIEAALRKILLHPAMMRVIHAAHSWGWELRVISDANVFFIQTVLASHQLEQYFTEVHSNPAHINELGVLRIHPYHSSPPHVCPICPPNMCKGLILDNIRAAAPSLNRRTIYVGDGRGDYCPSLRLREGDHVLAREGYPLWRLLKENTQLVKAKVHSWSSALDVESCLLHLYESEKIP